MPPYHPRKAHAFGACLLTMKSSASLSLKLSIYAVVNCNPDPWKYANQHYCINRDFNILVSVYILLLAWWLKYTMAQIYNGTASPTLVEKDCWSVYEYTPCQLMLLSFALGYMYRPVKTSRKENNL